MQTIQERLLLLFPKMKIRLNHSLNGELWRKNWVATISVSGDILGLPVRYLVEIKEAADRQAIEQFSAMISDTGSSKGYLICQQKAPKKLKDLASFKGIEIVLEEDFLSGVTVIEPEVPIKFFDPSLRTAEISESYIYNLDMIANPPKTLKSKPEDDGFISLDGGATQIKRSDYIVEKYLERKPDLKKYEKLDLTNERILTRLNDAWLLTNIVVRFKWSKPAFLIYFKEPELEQFKNQWKSRAVAADFVIKQLKLPEKERWIRIGNANLIPVKTNLSYHGSFELPEDMANWIPAHLSFNDD